MAKKGTKKHAPNWVPSSFDEADLKKAKKEGFLPASAVVIFPGDEVVPTPLAGYLVMFLAFLLCGLSLPAHEFLRGLLFVYGVQLISSRQIFFFISPASSLFVKLFWALTHTGFFGNYSFASVLVVL
jgi:hypothetical protein